MKTMLAGMIMWLAVQVFILHAQPASESESQSVKSAVGDFITKLQNRPTQILTGLFPLKFPSTYRSLSYHVDKPHDHVDVREGERKADSLDALFMESMKKQDGAEIERLSVVLSRELAVVKPAFVVNHAFSYSPDGKQQVRKECVFELSSKYRVTRVIVK